MSRHDALRISILTIYLVLLLCGPILNSSNFARASSSQLSLSANPSSVVIKVGDNATVNLALSTGEVLREVCFGEQGFPTSGFVLTFLPQCTITQGAITTTQLVVEATPAAAPQNFTAFIVASIGNQTASTPLTVTVVPAIPAWIPWLGILLFFLVIGAALFWKPRKPSKAKGKAKMAR